MRKMAFSWKAVGLFLVAFLMVANANLVGAPVHANLNDPDVRNALHWAVAEYNKRSNDAYLRGVSQVVNAQTQVVSGMKYIFTVILRSTGCKTGRACAAGSNQTKPYICTFEVWSQPWLHRTELVKSDCRVYYH
ncbi:cystatin-like [Brienomyrus brachyistius]|uniref:cystatin-like n=1 Tax=Brienomyrus brachyistius TaxID=42636 RepID=UPI0020B3F4CF|nr:cystatin-like [Brienomyrus brachyistius]